MPSAGAFSAHLAICFLAWSAASRSSFSVASAASWSDLAFSVAAFCDFAVRSSYSLASLALALNSTILRSFWKLSSSLSFAASRST